MERTFHQTLKSVNAIAKCNRFHPYTVAKVMQDSRQCIAITYVQFRQMHLDYKGTAQGNTQPATTAVQNAVRGSTTSPTGIHENGGATSDDIDFELLMDLDNEPVPAKPVSAVPTH